MRCRHTKRYLGGYGKIYAMKTRLEQDIKALANNEQREVLMRFQLPLADSTMRMTPMSMSIEWAFQASLSCGMS